MTNNFWNEERLNQLATLTAANVQANAELREQINALREQQENTNTNIDTLTGFINGHQQHITDMLNEIKEIKVDIRGLQLENRRMLEELRNRRER